MKKFTVTLCILIFIVFNGSSIVFSNTTEPLNVSLISYDPTIASILSKVNESTLRYHLENLVGFSPRYTGTYGCEQAAEYIHDHFEDHGLATRYQSWESFGNRYHPHLFRSQNVEATLQGTVDNVEIIFGGHYDTVKNTPGADDNTGTIAAVLVAASLLSQYSFDHTLKFVTFSGEEEGLHGSHAYAREAYHQENDILVYLNGDMIAHASTPESEHKFRNYATNDNAWMLELLEEVNDQYQIGFDLTQGIIDEQGRGGSDYFSFVEYGYDTLAFFEYDWNPRMHQPEDTIEHINFNYLINTTRLIIGAMAHLGKMDSPNPRMLITNPKPGYCYNTGFQLFPIRDLNLVIFDDQWIWPRIKEGNQPIASVEFYYDDILAFTDTEPPYKWLMNKPSFGQHTITIKAHDTKGNTIIDTLSFWYFNMIAET